MSQTMILDVVIGLGAGVVAGVFFFAGLRWTIDRLQASRRPLLLASTSLIVRASALGGLLVLASNGRFTRVAFASIAILAVRTVMVSRARADAEPEEMSWS